MNVGKTEGTQIIQLFGRGVRLKGYRWSLKRSNHLRENVRRLDDLPELELLCVFGVAADAMESFRKYLESEKLPGNEQRNVITVPLSVCRLDNKKLKVLSPKLRKDNGREYNFKTDGPVPEVNGDIPELIVKNRVVLDWYPRIQSMVSDGRAMPGCIRPVKNMATGISVICLPIWISTSCTSLPNIGSAGTQNTISTARRRESVSCLRKPAGISCSFPKRS